MQSQGILEIPDRGPVGPPRQRGIERLTGLNRDRLGGRCLLAAVTAERQPGQADAAVVDNLLWFQLIVQHPRPCEIQIGEIPQPKAPALQLAGRPAVLAQQEGVASGGVAAPVHAAGPVGQPHAPDRLSLIVGGQGVIELGDRPRLGRAQDVRRDRVVVQIPEVVLVRVIGELIPQRDHVRIARSGRRGVDQAHQIGPLAAVGFVGRRVRGPRTGVDSVGARSRDPRS